MAVGSRGNRSREAARPERDLAARFGCPHGTFQVVWTGRRGDWWMQWTNGPSLEPARAAVAELAGPSLAELLPRPA
jgi:hypothetical protein